MGVEGADLFTRLKRKGVVLAEREEQSATMIILHICVSPKAEIMFYLFNSFIET